MNLISKEAAIFGFLRCDEKAAASDSIRYLQSNMLSELPGLVFALITLAYLAASFLRLG